MFQGSHICDEAGEVEGPVTVELAVHRHRLVRHQSVRSEHLAVFLDDLRQRHAEPA